MMKRISAIVKLYPLKSLTSVSRCTFVEKFHEKEKAEEKYYIDRQERDVLKKLMKKVRETHVENAVEQETIDLIAVLKKHKVEPNDEILKDLKEWKQEHH